MVENVAIEMSFCQAAKSVHVATNVSQCFYLSGLWEEQFRHYFQALAKINLQHNRTLIIDQICRAYSIAMNSSINRENSYVDVRVQICVVAKIESLHFPATPLIELHTGTTVFKVVKDLLRGLLGVGWYKRLLFVAKDSAENMMGECQGAVTRFKQILLPGFLLIWFAAHRMDLTVLYVMPCVIKKSFCHSLVG